MKPVIKYINSDSAVYAIDLWLTRGEQFLLLYLLHIAEEKEPARLPKPDVNDQYLVIDGYSVTVNTELEYVVFTDFSPVHFNLTIQHTN